MVETRPVPVQNTTKPYWKPGGQSWRNEEGEERWNRKDRDFINVSVNDLNCDEYDPHVSVVDQISKESDEEVGVDLPIKDGPKKDRIEDLTDDEAGNVCNIQDPEELANHPTTDEERELPGVFRPERGRGWWGIGPIPTPMRKGLSRSLVDGAGLPLPGT